jgi:hypothetical protein
MRIFADSLVIFRARFAPLLDYKPPAHGLLQLIVERRVTMMSVGRTVPCKNTHLIIGTILDLSLSCQLLVQLQNYILPRSLSERSETDFLPCCSRPATCLQLVALASFDMQLRTGVLQLFRQEFYSLAQ